MRTSPLTPEEQKALEACRAEWLAVGLSTEPADRPEAEAAVKELYAAMGWNEPLVIWMDSPLGGALASAFFDNPSNAGKGYDHLGAQLQDQLRAELWAELQDQLWDQLEVQLRDQLGDHLGAQLRDQLGDQLWAELQDQLGDQLWAELQDQLWAQLCYAWWGQHDAFWIAWLLFAREVGVTYKKQHNDGLEAWARLTRSCGWWWPREGVAILTERHGRLLRHPDGSGRLHCEDGPAVAYPDGYELYAWRGVRVPKEAITDPDWLTPERITGEENAELRRCYMEIYGQGRYFKRAGGKLLDEVHEPPIPGLIDAKLWRLDNPDGPEPLVCVEVRNSTPEPDGSYKSYSLWCHPELRPLLPDGELGEPQDLTALNAVASTFGERGEDYLSVAVES